jgi:hypothetical protein
MRAWFWALGLGLGAWGCGAEVVPEPGGSGPGVGGSGVGGSGDCEEFFPKESGVPAKPVPVILRNDTATTLYLREIMDECSPPQYEAETLAGDELRTSFGSCASTCADVANGQCGCFLGCGGLVVVLLAPGGSYEMAWSRRLYDSRELPSACYAVDGCEPACFVPRTADEPLIFRAEGYPTVTCSSNRDCGCVPGAGGTCDIFEAAVSGTPVQASTQWNPGDETITIVFE